MKVNQQDVQDIKVIIDKITSILRKGNLSPSTYRNAYYELLTLINQGEIENES